MPDATTPSKDLQLGEATIILNLFKHRQAEDWEVFRGPFLDGQIDTVTVCTSPSAAKTFSEFEAIAVAREYVRIEDAKKAASRRKVEVFNRPECLFNYCPNPDLCRARCDSPVKT